MNTKKSRSPADTACPNLGDIIKVRSLRQLEGQMTRKHLFEDAEVIEIVDHPAYQNKVLVTLRRLSNSTITKIVREKNKELALQ